MLKLFLFLYLSLLSAFVSADGKTTYQFLSGDFAPYTSSSMANGGIATHIIRKVVNAMGHDIEVTYLPWRRGHLLALKGDYFGIFPYSKNEERKENWLFSEPLYELEEQIFVKQGQDFNYQSDKDLYNKSICRPRGYNLFGLKALRDKELVQIEQPPNLKACFLMLNIGRVDLVVTNPETGWSMIEALNLETKDFNTLSKPYLANAHHLIVSKAVKEGEAFLENFNKHLASLKRSGEVERLMKQFEYR